MIDQKVMEIAKALLDLRESKNRALDRREAREKFLQKLSDKEYKYNKEQWESLQVCIGHQQKKRLKLTCDLMTIQEMLKGIQKLQKEELHDWYA